MIRPQKVSAENSCLLAHISILLDRQDRKTDMPKKSEQKSTPVLKVHQWLTGWDKINWHPGERRTKPQRWFYQFSMPATDLKALSGIYARTTKRAKASEDLGIQRRHEKQRSDEISEFVKFGYPWSDLSEAKRESGDFQDLRQPGWLPTSIVVNILGPEDERLGKKVSESDLVRITDSENCFAELLLPENFNRNGWKPKTIPPIEVIDGQHRLWAFEDPQLRYEDNYELPVIAFVGLDLSWQAYLFYTINIKPKKINPSLAFDLYPLLRTEEWLTKFEGHVIYREIRAQEVVDLLWAHPDSPWHHRINMLGEPGFQGLRVTQSAWIRSLLASFVKRWKGGNVNIGGLFGSLVGEHQTVLPWSRTDQAAFLMVTGQLVKKSIANSQEAWVKTLREYNQAIPDLFEEEKDPAFFGANNLLNQDQGVRTLMQIVNDLCFKHASELELHDWKIPQNKEESDHKEVVASMKSLCENQKIFDFLKQLSEHLSSYDWRASSAPGLSNEEKAMKARFRGSGGYRELRRDVLLHISKGQGSIARTAREILDALG